jgi:hypothetical protein
MVASNLIKSLSVIEFFFWMKQALTTPKPVKVINAAFIKDYRVKTPDLKALKWRQNYSNRGCTIHDDL